MAETVKKPAPEAAADPAHDEFGTRLRAELDQYVKDLTALRESAQDDPARQRAVSRGARRLRTAENEADRQDAREEIRDAGGVPGDFVLQLADGSFHRVEVPATHHNGMRVVATHEDVQ